MFVKTTHIYKKKVGSLNIFYKDNKGETHKVERETAERLQLPGDLLDPRDYNEIGFAKDEFLEDEPKGCYIRKIAVLWKDRSQENNYFVEFGLGNLDPVKGYITKSALLVGLRICFKK